MKPKRKTARRGNGEGSIFQRADGRWVGRISLGYDANGKRKQRTVYGKTKRDVQGELTKLQGQKIDGTFSEAGKLTVGDYLNRWLQDTARTTVKASTFVNYESLVRVHASPNLGGMRLEKLRPAHITALYAEMERKGASARVRQHTHAVLHRAMKDAVRGGLIPQNPAAAVDPPKYHKPEIQPLSAEQAREFLEAVGPRENTDPQKSRPRERFEALYVLALTTGMRQGELLALRWEDVSLEDGYLTVRFSLRWNKGEPILAAPKSKKGRRKIDLPTLAIDALNDHRKRMMATGFAGESYVFCNGKGNPIHKANLLNRSFYPILKGITERRAEEAERRGETAEPFPSIRFHDLRHTAATLMLLEGVHPKVDQERLGHSQISMTLDTYSHVLPSMQADAAERLGRILSIA